MLELSQTEYASAEPSGFQPDTGIPVACANCGTPYTVQRLRPDRTKNHLCPICRGRAQAGKIHDGFTTPPSTKAERVRANGLVNKRVKLGHFTPPTSCAGCGKDACRLDMHHPDYGKPDEVLFLCRGCHQRIHLNHSAFPDMIPVRVVAPADWKRPTHHNGGRKGSNGRPKLGRRPLVRIQHTMTIGTEAVEFLACGHEHRRPADGSRPVQRRCRQCPRPLASPVSPSPPQPRKEKRSEN